MQETNKSILALLLSASRVHATSDDGFEVDYRLFLEKFHPITSSPKKAEIFESPDFPAMYNRVISWLRFLEIILLTKNNSATSTKTVTDHFKLFSTLLPALIGLRNQQVSELSCHVYRLLLGKLDILSPGGTCSPEVSETSFFLKQKGLTPRSNLLTPLPQMIWEAIQIPLEASSHANLAFSIWLSWVSLSSINSRPSQTILNEDKYWSLLQVRQNPNPPPIKPILNSTYRLVSLLASTSDENFAFIS